MLAETVPEASAILASPCPLELPVPDAAPTSFGAETVPDADSDHSAGAGLDLPPGNQDLGYWPVVRIVLAQGHALEGYISETDIIVTCKYQILAADSVDAWVVAGEQWHGRSQSSAPPPPPRSGGRPSGWQNPAEDLD